MKKPIGRLSIPVIVAALAMLAALSCNGSTSPTEPGAESTMQTVLRVGETLQVTPSVAIRFDDVVGDSRCPTGVSCVWEGEATVGLTLKDASGSERFQLTTRTAQATVRGYKVRLMSVEPYPAAGSEIPVDAYRITIRVDA